MLRQAARELNIDLASSWMVGDILDDVEAGRRAGCRTILIDNGHETEWDSGVYRSPHAMAADVSSAADIILACDGVTVTSDMDDMMARSDGPPYGC
jgi:phosphoglycolate phosphatase-like HAD superfamily hydrolase